MMQENVKYIWAMLYYNQVNTFRSEKENRKQLLHDCNGMFAVFYFDHVRLRKRK